MFNSTQECVEEARAERVSRSISCSDICREAVQALVSYSVPWVEGFGVEYRSECRVWAL